MEGVDIHGLTTAACLWIAAAIGMACGAGLYTEALLITIIAITALVFLPYVEVIFKKHSYRVLEITCPLGADVSSVLDRVIVKNIRVERSDLDRDYSSGVLTITLLIRLYHKGVTDKHAHSIIKAIESLDFSTKTITWRSR
ncbi:MAG: MgtC/SapB family protein [Anaerolineales bacterium]|nr:MgtC/SapB family protein [Anaerolineales bacterium]